MLRYYKQKHHFINFFVNIHICLLSVSKSLQQRYIFSCLWHCQQLPVCFKCLNLSQYVSNVSKCLKMSQNQLNFLKTHLRHFETFWAILSNFERIFGAGMRHFETFWIDFEQFWAILSNFERIFVAGMRHFETFWVDFEQFWAIWAILSNFERFWAILSGICSASNLYIWIVLSIYMSFLHNWNSQLWRLKLGRNVFAHFILIFVLV